MVLDITIRPTPESTPDLTLEQQQALALARARIRLQDQDQDQDQASNGLGFINRGIANSLGAPVDLANSALGLVGLDTEDPIGGSSNIEEGLRALGIGVPQEGQQPSGIGESIAQGVGGAIGGLLPLGGIARALQAGTGAAANVGNTLLQTIARNPIATTAADVGSGATSGIGGQGAADLFPNSPIARPIGEILGGVTPTATVSTAKNLPGVKLASKVINSTIFPFTPKGGTIRAENRLQGLVPNPTQAAAAIDEPTLTNLTPAQRSGDKNLLALERTVLNKNVNLEDQFAQRSAANVQELKQELQTARGEGAVTDTRQFLQDRLQRAKTALDARTNQALDFSQQRIAQLQPEQRVAQASLIARQEVENALKDAKVQENALWDQVPKEVKIAPEATIQAYKKIIKETPRAQREDIPSVVSTLKTLKPKVSNNVNTEDSFIPYSSHPDPYGIYPTNPSNVPTKPKMESVRELQGLRSKLLEQSRISRAEGKYNKARISDILADAVLEDLGAQANNIQGPVGQSLRDALDFSRTVNTKFRQGIVGDILGSERVGGDTIASELTLDKTIGTGGIKGDVQYKQLLAAADTPELRESVQQYLLNQFKQSAIKGDAVKPDAARKFLEKNNDLLDKFPELRTQIDESLSAHERALQVSGRNEFLKKSLSNTQQSKASQFLNSPVDKEIEKIVTSKDPKTYANQLVRQTSKDKTGLSLKGLRSASVDYLLQRATIKNAEGEIVSGQNILNDLQNPAVRTALTEILPPNSLQRIEKIANELKKIQVGGKAELEHIINDNPHTYIDLAVRIIGAREGAKFGKGGASLQTSGFFAKRYSSILRHLTNDKAQDILIQSVQDPELMKALLTNTTTRSGKKLASQRMHAWLLGPGMQLIEHNHDQGDQP